MAEPVKLGGVLGKLINDANGAGGAHAENVRKAQKEISSPVKVFKRTVTHGAEDTDKVLGGVGSDELKGAAEQFQAPEMVDIILMDDAQKGELHKRAMEWSQAQVDSGNLTPLLGQKIETDQNGEYLSDSVGRFWHGNWFQDGEGNAFDENGRQLDWADRLAKRVRSLID